MESLEFAVLGMNQGLKRDFIIHIDYYLSEDKRK